MRRPPGPTYGDRPRSALRPSVDAASGQLCGIRNRGCLCASLAGGLVLGILFLFPHIGSSPPATAKPTTWPFRSLPTAAPFHQQLPRLVRVIDPKLCAWTEESPGEIFAPVQFDPPYWLALPRDDARFAAAVNFAQEGAQLDLSVSSPRTLSAELLASFKPGSVIVDVGADVGIFALQVAALLCGKGEMTLQRRVCAEAEGRFTVVAFEPQEDRAVYARRSVARNCFTNMILSTVALAARNETTHLFVPFSNSMAASLSTRLVPHMGASFARQVQTKALDVWLREQELELSNIRFIRIDVPSTALHILRGAYGALRAAPTLYVLLTVDAALMHHLRESPIELLVLISAAGLTPYYDHRAWHADQFPELDKLLSKAGEVMLHCIKSKHLPVEAPVRHCIAQALTARRNSVATTSWAIKPARCVECAGELRVLRPRCV